ncbi:armadillo-type protein [Cyathus striatus]|nr:armadillo-type protein [Cyathus striatus]
MMESAQSDISRDAGYDAEAAEPAKAKSPTELKHDVKHGQKEEEGWGKQFKPDAKIWELYLKDAEEEAKERAELWKTGLDSLLIFAGLFAGIVSAFVVDESNVPQQSSVGGASNLSPSAVSLWVEGLWLTSLLITLSCAVMGVLAKAWIAKFIPVSSKRGAKDAYDRCILDKRAKRWHLERVIMFIPLLLQIAAFLFTIGLAIRSFDANARIGKLAIVLVSIGVAGYLAITMIPVYYPTSPFQTPLSDLFILIKNVLKWEGGIFEAPNGWSENSIEGELADIWLRKLMKSSKASHVVEAIAELTRQWPSFEPEWRQYFGESASPMIISRRLQEYMRDGLHHKADKTEELCYHLEALLHLAHHFEELNNRLPKSPLFQGLVKTLSPAGPLRNWNVFQEEVRPLAYSLRTHVMIIARNSQSITCKSLSPAVTDIPPSELEDRPWEIMAHKVQPRHRLNFVIASCRGLVEGERNIQTVSSFVLSLSLAKAALAGTTNEWSGEVHKDKKKEAKSLAEKYLEILFDKIAQKWESMVVSEDTNITNTNANQAMLNGDVLSQHLISRLSEMMLSDPDKGIKKTDLNITIVEQIATALLLYGDNQFRIQVIPIIANLLNDRDATQHLIPNLTELMLRDPDKVVQITVLKALILDSLHNIEQYFSAIKASLPSSNFSADIEPLEAFIADSINLLATIVLVKENEELRNTGYELLKDLFKYGKLQSKIELAMTKSLATALGNLWAKSNEHLNILKNALRFLYEFEIFVSREQTNLETWINIFIIDRIFDHKSLSYYARGWLTDFLDIPKNDESSETPLIEDHSREEYHNCIKRLQELVNLGNEEEWRDKIQATISTRLIQELKCEHMPSRVVAIKLCVDSSWILTLFGMGITDIDLNVRIESMKQLKVLVRSQNADSNVLETLKSRILPELDKHLGKNVLWLRRYNSCRSCELIGASQLQCSASEETESDEDVRIEAIESLTSIIMADGEVTDVQILLQIIVKGAKEDTDDAVRLTAIKSLGSLITNLNDNILGDLSKMILSSVASTSVPIDSEWDICIEWVRSFNCLAKRKVYDTIPLIINIAKEYTDEDVRVHALECLTSLVTSDEELQETVKQMLSDITIIEDSSDEVQLEWIRLRVILGQQEVEASIKMVIFLARYAAGSTRTKAMTYLTSQIEDGYELQESVKNILSDAMEEFDDLKQFRTEWIQLLTLLAQQAKMTEGVANSFTTILKVAKGDSYEAVRLMAVKSIISLIDNDEIRSEPSVKQALAEVDLPTNSNWETRKEWIKLFTILAQQNIQYSLTRIVKMAKNDRNEDVRLDAVQSLLNALKGNSDLQNSLSLIIKMAKEDDEEEIRLEALNSLKTLLDGSADRSQEGFVEAISSVNMEFGLNCLNDPSKRVCLDWVKLMEHLLPVAAHKDDDVQKSAIDAFSNQYQHGRLNPSNVLILSGEIESGLKHLHCEVRSRAIKAVQFVSKVDGTNKKKESIQNSKFTTRYARSCKWQYSNAEENNVVLSSVRRLVLVIRESRKTHVRTTASEVLTYIFTEYGETNSQIIDDTIPDIITIALDEKPPYPQVRDLALDLIIVIGNVGTQDANVRKAILLHIISLSTTHGTKSFKGYITLLSRLLLERRLKDESTDYVIMLLACTLVRQPRLTHLRFQVVSALWCNYREERGEMKRPIPGELVNWFTHALFGSHATPTEVHTWCKLGAKWLNNARVDMQVTLEEENRGCGGIGMRATSVTTNDDSAPEG